MKKKGAKKKDTNPDIHKTQPLLKRMKRPAPSAFSINLSRPYPPGNRFQLFSSEHQAHTHEKNGEDGFEGNVEREAGSGRGC